MQNIREIHSKVLVILRVCTLHTFATADMCIQYNDNNNNKATINVLFYFTWELYYFFAFFFFIYNYNNNELNNERITWTTWNHKQWFYAARSLVLLTFSLSLFPTLFGFFWILPSFPLRQLNQENIKRYMWLLRELTNQSEWIWEWSVNKVKFLFLVFQFFQ